MRCLRCQHENPAQSRFCFECGARLTPTCSRCGVEFLAGVKFCNQCGQAAEGQAPTTPRLVSPDTYTPRHLAERILTSKAALEGERKQVTVLFADLKGSMELLADRDPEEARKLLDRPVPIKGLGEPIEAHALCLAGGVAATGGAEDAEGYYHEALALADDLGMRPLVAHCHLGLGKLYQRTGQRAQARETPHRRHDDVRRHEHAILD
jgi:Double zinc ribbon